MGNKIHEIDGNVGQKNNISRRDAISKGVGAIMASLLGSQISSAQENAVAVVTNPQNVPGRTLETVAPQSGFVKAIVGLQTEIAALQDEFKKGNIDSKKMEELLTKLLLNEKGITTEVQKTLDIIFDKLGKTYKFLPEGDKRKAEIKNVGDTIIRIKSGLLEGDNLIKAMRFICELCGNEKFRGETSTINKSYFKGIVDFFDTTTGGMIDGITKYETSFQAMPSQEIKDLKKKLAEMKNPISTDDLEPKKGDITLAIKKNNEGGLLKENNGYAKLAKGNIEIKDGVMRSTFNSANDCPTLSTEQIALPEKTKKIDINLKLTSQLKAGKLIPAYIIFFDAQGGIVSSSPLHDKKTNGITVPPSSKKFSLDLCVLREKATGNAQLEGIQINIK